MGPHKLSTGTIALSSSVVSTKRRPDSISFRAGENHVTDANSVLSTKAMLKQKF